MIIWFLLVLFLHVSEGVVEIVRVEESSWINGSVSNGAVWTVAFELGDNTSKVSLQYVQSLVNNCTNTYTMMSMTYILQLLQV